MFVAQLTLRLGWGSGSALLWGLCFALNLADILNLTLLKEVVDATQILPHTAIAELVDLINNAVKELSVVRDNDNSAVKLADSLLKDIL